MKRAMTEENQSTLTQGWSDPWLLPRSQIAYSASVSQLGDISDVPSRNLYAQDNSSKHTGIGGNFSFVLLMSRLRSAYQAIPRNPVMAMLTCQRLLSCVLKAGSNATTASQVNSPCVKQFTLLCCILSSVILLIFTAQGADLAIPRKLAIVSTEMPALLSRLCSSSSVSHPHAK